jgi:glyoxylase-like metal-dependent hydrolase (beta-lactamase superfamily II)
MIDVYCSTTGVFVENTYFLINSEDKWGVIVDPGKGALGFLEQLKMEEISWKAIFLTHAHFDHLLGLRKVVEYVKVPIYLHKEDLFLYNLFVEEASKFGYKEEILPQPDLFWEDNDELVIGKTKFEIIHTPGHTPGSVCVKWEDGLLTGDTLMYHTIGRTDWFGSFEDIQSSITEKLFSLPDELTIYPGHHKVSSIEEEKMFNLEIF